MPPAGGRRTSLAPIVSYVWGGWGSHPAGELLLGASEANQGRGSNSASRGDVTQFRDVFQPGQGIFSPAYPLVPPEPERVRLWDFPVGYNTIYTPRSYEPIGFDELRALAESHDITRLAIETRKDQIEKLEWTIKSRNERNPAADAPSRIERLTEFWLRPDGEQPFATWLREALEDVLVLDAPAFEVRRNRGGDIIGLDVVDGATIKVLIDDTGRRPQPPAPAYEQVIHGRPWRLLSDDELIYLPRNRRPHKAYGFGPVEQIVVTVNIGLRRQIMQLQHFTEGNVPPGLLSAPDNWNTEQIQQYQDWWDSVLQGNTGSRTRLLWGPSGAKYQAFKEAPYKDDFDEWLARIVCYAFSLPPTAFTPQVNRATAQTAQEAALEEGLAPLMGWVKRLVDSVIQNRMGHTDIEFVWSNVRPTDPKDQSEILTGYVKDGIYTLNEARDILGLDPVEGGDEPMFLTAQGPVRLREAGAPQTATPAGTVEE
jgi:HK97 family phage portal protein